VALIELARDKNESVFSGHRRNEINVKNSIASPAMHVLLASAIKSANPTIHLEAASMNYHSRNRLTTGFIVFLFGNPEDFT